MQTIKYGTARMNQYHAKLYRGFKWEKGGMVACDDVRCHADHYSYINLRVRRWGIASLRRR